MTTKKPSVSTPRYACAQIRKILKAQGWPMYKISGRYSAYGAPQDRTEGYQVSKVGCSRKVVVRYAHNPNLMFNPAEERAERTERDAAAITLLRGLGYAVDDRGYIECAGYDDCDR
jgi:hypothetical protein